MSGDISKLPVWARREIEHLRGEVRTLTRQLGDGPQDTDTWIKRYATSDTPLAPGEQIEFRLPDKEADVGSDREVMHAKITTRSGRRVLELSCLGGSLAVYPQVTNVVHIRVEGW